MTRLRLVSDTDPPVERATGPSVLSLDLPGLRRGGKSVLGPVSLRVAKGETVALIGPSGIGKTSLLRAIAGLDPVTEGKIDAPDRVALVFQEPTLLRWRRAIDNIRLATGCDRGTALGVMEEVGLDGLHHRFPDQLSLGQQRRLALARAFASQPDLMLMDEPFVSLDPETADEMMRLFARLRARRGLATILVTHVRDEAEKLASRIVTLGGSPATVTEDRQNKGAYFQLSASGVTSSRS